MAEEVWLLAAALPLCKVFDKHNFVCRVPEYQRKYEWEKETHTLKLMTDLQQAFERNQDVMLLGNVILQQTDQGALREQNASDWCKERMRFCDIVDGQQRITTVVMLYAAIQDLLQRNCEAHQSARQQLSARLGTMPTMPTPFLTTQQRDFTEWFSFEDSNDLGEVLDRQARQRLGRVERGNALYMLDWLKTQIETKSMDVGAFLSYLDEHVYLTLTVTSGKSLAFQTFANVNYSGENSRSDFSMLQNITCSAMINSTVLLTADSTTIVCKHVLFSIFAVFTCFCANAGKPLQNQDILKAMLLENIPERHRQNDRTWLVNRWSKVARDLDTLQGDLIRNYCTKAWKHSDGVSQKKVFRGSINLDRSLMGELLERMRHLNDPER